MSKQEFYNSQFFLGEVRDRTDPLGLGRMRVKIFGYYVDIPDEDLPWCHSMFPVNGSKSFSMPEIGDWVIGTFLNNLHKQEPIILGVLPGLKNNS